MIPMPAVEKYELFVIRLPLVRPFTTSFGTETHKEALLVKLTGNGVTGWGECTASPEPFYSYETTNTAMLTIRDFLVPAIKLDKGISITDIPKLFNQIRGHNMAKAAVENALLDLAARTHNIPLYELLGGTRKKIMSGISIGIKEDTSELVDLIGQAVNTKYNRIKIKIKKGMDLKVLEKVRSKFPDLKLMADANSDYSIEDLSILKKMDAFNLMMIEQPLHHDDIYYHSFVQKELKTPVCLDESIKNLRDAKTASGLKSCRIINIKQGRVGGALAAKEIAAFCLDNGLQAWSGGMLETGIGRAMNIQLQTLPGYVLPGDTSETSRYFDQDIVDKPVVLDPDGFIELPDSPGIGVNVVEEKLNYFRKFHLEL